jgi:hypothetical protein
MGTLHFFGGGISIAASSIFFPINSEIAPLAGRLCACALRAAKRRVSFVYMY